MRSFGPLLIATALLLATTFCRAESSATAPVSAPSARGVIEVVVRDVLNILRDPTLTKADKLAKIRAVADQQTDFQTLARLSLGRNWRDLSESQQAEFVKEFENYLSATHGHVFDQYVDEDVVINGDHAESRGDYTVQSTIVSHQSDAGRKKEVAKLDYRLRQQDGQWKIIDITVDGVSLAVNFRAQFQDIMANGGFERLMKLLREKNASAKQ